MNIYEVRVTTQAQEHIRDIAYHIAVTLHAPDAAQAMPISTRPLIRVILAGTLPQFLVSLRLVEYKVSPGYSHSPSRRVTIIV